LLLAAISRDNFDNFLVVCHGFAILFLKFFGVGRQLELNLPQQEERVIQFSLVFGFLTFSASILKFVSNLLKMGRIFLMLIFNKFGPFLINSKQILESKRKTSRNQKPMKIVLLFLLVGVNLTQAVDQLRKTLKTKWQSHDKQQENYRNYLAKLPPKARCLKIVAEINGKSKYYQMQRSMAYVDMLQTCEAFLIPRESSHLKQISKKFNEHLKITGYHNIYENNGSIQIFRNMENKDEIKWEDPNNFMAAMGNDIKERFENCLRLPEHQRPNCISDELPKWNPDERARPFGRKILFSLLNKVHGKTMMLHGRNYFFGGPEEYVEVTRKECCISLLLNDFPPATENEALEFVNDIVKILKEDNKLDKILLPRHYTALIVTVLWNQMKFAEIILKANASVDAQDYFGMTALMHSVGNLGKMKILLKYNPNVNIQDNQGNTALMIATSLGKYYLKNVNLLIRAGAKIDVQDNLGQTALMRAADYGYSEKVKILLKANAGINIQDKTGRTALMKAAEFGRIKTMKVLLKAKAETDIQGENGITALILSAARGNLEAVKLLLNANANVKIISENLDAAGFARQNGHNEVAQAINQFDN
jgi:ankyrin repeat protein